MHPVLLFLTVAMIQSAFSQGCTRVFGRYQPSINQPTAFQQGEPKSELEIANAALQEVCEGVCTENFDIPQICPIAALNIVSSEISGFAFLPTYDMVLLATGNDLTNSNLYKISITFDFNEFSSSDSIDVYIQSFSYTEETTTISEVTKSPTPTLTPNANIESDGQSVPEPEIEFDFSLNLLDEIDEVVAQDQDVGGVSPFSFVLGDLDTITVQVDAQGE